MYDNEELSGGNEIYFNDKYFFEHFFQNNPMEAVRATQFGKYNYKDTYVWFNGYANLESTEWEDELPLHDVEELFEWCMNNTSYISHFDEFENFLSVVEYGFDDEN